MNLNGQIAVVTGAGRGIGSAVSVALAGAGATVVLVSRTTAHLEAVRRGIEATGGTAVAVREDITL